MRRIDSSPIRDNSESTSRRTTYYLVALTVLLAASLAVLMVRPVVVHGSALATDPGPRPLPAAAGKFYSNLTANQNAITNRLTQIFTEVNFVAGGPLVKTVGLGPRFNSNSCSSCHAYPAVGGSSPPSNPLFGIYQLQGATNTMPYFITSTGPSDRGALPLQVGWRYARWRRPPDVHHLEPHRRTWLHHHGPT